MTQDDGMRHGSYSLGLLGKFVMRRSSLLTRRGLYLALVAVSMLAALQSLQAEEWLRRDGHAFEAHFARLRGTAVVFTRDNLEFAVPISALTPASLE
jgi:hypothetical protein